MNVAKRRARAAAVALLAVAGAAAARGDDKRPDAAEVGKLAPALAVGSWKNTKGLTLDDLKGKVVLIDFFGVW